MLRTIFVRQYLIFLRQWKINRISSKTSEWDVKVFNQFSLGFSSVKHDSPPDEDWKWIVNNSLRQSELFHLSSQKPCQGAFSEIDFGFPSNLLKHSPARDYFGRRLSGVEFKFIGSGITRGFGKAKQCYLCARRLSVSFIFMTDGLIGG